MGEFQIMSNKNIIINGRCSVTVYNKEKYDPTSKAVRTVKYPDAVAWEVIEPTINPEEVAEIERFFDDHDPHHEYLRIWFRDSTHSTFRNSFTDLFLH